MEQLQQVNEELELVTENNQDLEEDEGSRRGLGLEETEHFVLLLRIQ